MRIEQSNLRIECLDLRLRTKVLEGKWSDFKRFYVVKTDDCYFLVTLNIFERMIKNLMGSSCYFGLNKLKYAKTISANELLKIVQVSQKTGIRQDNIVKTKEPSSYPHPFNGRAYALDLKCPIPIQSENEFLFAQFYQALDVNTHLENSKRVYFTYRGDSILTPLQSIVKVDGKGGKAFYIPVTAAFFMEDQKAHTFLAVIGKPFSLSDQNFWNSAYRNISMLKESDKYLKLRHLLPKIDNWWWGDLIGCMGHLNCCIPIDTSLSIRNQIGTNLPIGEIDKENGGIKVCGQKQIYFCAPLGFDLIEPKDTRECDIKVLYGSCEITLHVHMNLARNPKTNEKIAVICKKPEAIAYEIIQNPAQNAFFKDLMDLFQ